MEILDLLNTLLSTTTPPEEKKQRLHDEFDIAMTVEFESEVQEMCNLSEALVELGAEREKTALAKLMIEENESVEKIERYTGYALEKLKEIADGIGKPLIMG